MGWELLILFSIIPGVKVSVFFIVLLSKEAEPFNSHSCLLLAL